MNLPSVARIHQAAAIIGGGGLVALPTETLYGLAVDPFNTRALENLFAAKKRALEKPVLVLIGQMAQVNLLASSVPGPYHMLMEHFWPGPLTLLFPARPELSSLLTGGNGAVGIRQSPAPVVQALIQAHGGPITGTSANISGEAPSTTSRQVAAQLGDRVDLILTGPELQPSQGSTIVGLHKGHLHCIREGDLPWSRIRKTLLNAESQSGVRTSSTQARHRISREEYR